MLRLGTLKEYTLAIEAFERAVEVTSIAVKARTHKLKAQADLEKEQRDCCKAVRMISRRMLGKLKIMKRKASWVIKRHLRKIDKLDLHACSVINILCILMILLLSIPLLG